MNKSIENIVILIILTFTILAISFEFSVSSKIIDLSDEGFNLCRLKFPEFVTASLVKDHLYFSKIFYLMEYNIKNFRILNILTLVLLCFVTSYSFTKYIENTEIVINKHFWLLLSCVLILCNIQSFWLERIPAYNSAITYLSMSLFSLFFLNIKSINKNKIFLLPIGCFIGFAFIIRPPSGVSLLIISLILSTIIDNKYCKNVILIIFGISISFIIHFALIENLSSYIHTFKKGLEFQQSFHDSGNIFFKYYNEIFQTLKFCILSNKYILITYIISHFIFTHYLSKNKTTLLYLIFLVIISLKHYFLKDIDGGQHLYWYQWRYYISQYIISIVFVILYNYKNTKIFFEDQNFGIFAISFLLIISPFIISLGTSNIILFNMNFYAYLSMIGIILLLFYFTVFRSRDILIVLLILSAGPTFSYFNARSNKAFYSVTYTSGGFLEDAKYKISTNNQDLFVINKTAEIIEKFSSSFSSHFSKLAYIANFTDMPGLNYFLDKPHPFNPWTRGLANNFTLHNLTNNQFLQTGFIFEKNDYKSLDLLNHLFPSINSSHEKIENVSIIAQGHNLEYVIFVPIKQHHHF